MSRQNFTHIPSDFALGFTHATTWLKIETTITPESGTYFLSLWPPRLENCQLFAQSTTNNNFVEIHSTPEGKRLGNVFYDTFKRNVFDLSAFRDTHVFYLKVISDNSLIGNVSLLTNQNIDLHRANEGFLLGGVAFGLVPFLLIFLALAIYKKEPIYLVYFFSLLTTTFLYLSIYGFDWVEIVFKKNVTLDHQVGLMGIINIYFSYTFLSYVCQLLGTPIQITSKMRFFMLGCLIFIPAYIWLDRQTSLSVFYWLALINSAAILYCIFVYSDKRSFLQWLIAILFSIITIGAAKVFLTMLGIIRASDDVLFSQSLRILTIPFALLVLVGYFELESNRYVLNLRLEKALSEQNKRTEAERRKVYESFISMLVHEIKTPLSVIQIAASSLSRHLSENKTEANRISKIKKSVTEINQIFNKCIQVVDIENGSVAIETSEFSTDFLCDDIARNVGDDRLEIICSEKIKLRTDYVLLKTICMNLISNGLKYGKHDSKVTLEVSQSRHQNNSQTTFTVSNEIGDVGAPDNEKIFKRYYRSESAKKYTGSGLGLWLSQQLANILESQIFMSIHERFVHFHMTIADSK